MDFRSIWDLAVRRVRRVRAGLDTPWEFLLLCVDYAAAFLTKKNPQFHINAMQKRFRKTYFADSTYVLKDVRLPSMGFTEERAMAWGGWEDVFFVYLRHDDCYEETSMKFYYDLLWEGTYGFRNESVDVTVRAGDIVVDAGSWIGDFAAYASAKGAVVYAFEPFDGVYADLLKTATLNKNVYPVKKGLSDVETEAVMTANPNDSSMNSIVSEHSESGGLKIELTTIDAFVRENGLERVDFIKADIEGHERYMLQGAKETLKKFAPKLAICTYHLPDDPEVLAGIIREANPAYNIVQKRKKLYASVPKSGERRR